MNRWTMEALERTDDLDFAVCILNERRSGLNAYSPLSVKLAQAARKIQDIKAERDRYLARLTEIKTEETGSTETPLEDMSADSFEARCEPCNPTSPECDDCDYNTEEGTEVAE